MFIPASLELHGGQRTRASLVKVASPRPCPKFVLDGQGAFAKSSASARWVPSFHFAAAHDRGWCRPNGILAGLPHEQQVRWSHVCAAACAGRFSPSRRGARGALAARVDGRTRSRPAANAATTSRHPSRLGAQPRRRRRTHRSAVARGCTWTISQMTQRQMPRQRGGCPQTFVLSSWRERARV